MGPIDVVCYPANLDASAYYRLQVPTAILAGQGASVRMGDPAEALSIETASVIVLQRPLDRRVPDVIRDAQSHGIAVVVDLDDDFEAVDPKHSMYAKLHDVGPTIREACQLADLVTTSTQALADKYGYGHSIVLPNYIPQLLLHTAASPELIEAKADAQWVGWTGTLGSHPRDPQVTGNGIRRALLDNPGSRFCAIGDPRGLPKAFGLGQLDILASGFVPLNEYARTYAALDVALVPLAGTAFNDAKSWLKGLEAAALGIPFVASPTAEYRELARHGMGQLAADPSHWRRHVGALLKSKALRTELGGQYRERASKFTAERHAERWWDAWVTALLASRSLCKPAVV